MPLARSHAWEFSASSARSIRSDIERASKCAMMHGVKLPPRDLVDHTPGRPQQWPDVDGDIKEWTDQIIERLGLLRGVVGVYLHGSLAMGGFYRPKSDLDLLVVVDSPLTDEHRRSLATDMLGRNNVRRFEAFAHSGHRRLQAADSQRCSYRIRRRAS